MPSATSQTSVQDVKRQLSRILRKVQSNVDHILDEEAVRIHAEAVSLTPYQTGKLESSVRTSRFRDKRSPGINISASAKSIRGYDYSGVQHEREDFQHPIKGQAGFLRIPMEHGIERIVARIRSEGLK